MPEEIKAGRIRVRWGARKVRGGHIGCITSHQLQQVQATKPEINSHFVNKEDDGALCLGHLFQDGLEPFLELPAHRGASD